MSTQIHPTAIVSDKAQIGENVVIKAYAIIEDDVIIGDSCVIGSHSVIQQYTKLGSNNKLDPHSVLGGLPQDVSFDTNSETWLEFGNDNIIREFTNIHRSTNTEKPTKIGSGNYIMGHVHIGHDCTIGNDNTIANYTGLGGHVEMGDKIVMGAGSKVHQFCRIGSYTMMGATTMANKDILPYTLVKGDPAKHYKLNSVGLRRNGIKGDNFKAIERIFRSLRSGSKELPEVESSPETEYLKSWLEIKSKRGLSSFIIPA